MLAGGIALRTQGSGLVGLIGLLLAFTAAFGLARAALFACGLIAEPGGRREPDNRDRAQRSRRR